MKTERTNSDKTRNGKRGFLVVFYLSLAFLLIVDFFVHRHADVSWEGVPEFFAVYGFISCVLLILVARLLRIFIKRNENYYD